MSSRKEAKKLGLTTYKGRACKKCGSTEKYVTDAKCIICKRFKLLYDRGVDITPDQYDKLLKKQKKRCAICSVHQKKLKKKLSVDHDHSTGKVRGLLCQTCNVGLGQFNDDLETVKNALRYLHKHG